MKLKKLLAAVTAAALAVSTMATTGFTASAEVSGNDWTMTSGEGSITYTLTAPPAEEGEASDQNQAVSNASTVVDISSLVDESDGATFRCVNVTGTGGSVYVQYPGGGPDNLSIGPATITNKTALSSVTIGTWWITPGDTQTITFTVEYGEPITKKPRSTTQSNTGNVYTGVVSAAAPPDANTIWDGSAESILVDLTTILPEDFSMANVRKISADVSSTSEGTDGTIGMNVGDDWVSAMPNWNSGNSSCSISTPAGLGDTETELEVQIWHAVGGETVTAEISVEDVDGNVYPDSTPASATAEIAFDATEELYFEIQDISDEPWNDTGYDKRAYCQVEKYPASGVSIGDTYGKLKNTTISVTGIEFRNFSVDGLTEDDVEVSVFAVWGAVGHDDWDETFSWTQSDDNIRTWDLSTLEGIADNAELKMLGYAMGISGGKGGINDMSVEDDFIIVNSSGAAVPTEASIAFSTEELELTVSDASDWGDEGVTKAAQLLVEVYPTGITKGLPYSKLKNTTLSLTGVEIKNTSIVGLPLDAVDVSIYAEWDKEPAWTASGGSLEWDLGDLAEAGLSGNARLTGLGYLITIAGGDVNDMDDGDIVKVNFQEGPVPEEILIAFDTDEIELVVADNSQYGEPGEKVAKKQYGNIFPTGVTPNKTYGDMKNSTVTLTGIEVNNVISSAGDDLSDGYLSIRIIAQFIVGEDNWSWSTSADWERGNSSSVSWDLSEIEGIDDNCKIGNLGYEICVYGDKVNALDEGDIVKVNSSDDVDDTDRVYALLWEGTRPMPDDWSGNVQIDIDADLLSKIKVGDKIVSTIVSADGAQFSIKYKDTGWPALPGFAAANRGNDYTDPITATMTTYTHIVTAADIEAMAFGLAISGHDYTLTKVELNPDKKPTEKPPVVEPGDDPAHTHTPATVWSSDATGHWYACSGCDDKLEFAPHTSDTGTVTTPATETTAGTKTYKCTVCGYVMDTEPIPATGTGNTPAPETPIYGYTGAPVIPTWIGGGTSSNTPTISGDSSISGWDAIGKEISAASDGTKIEIDMNGTTRVPSSIFKNVKDKDVDLVFNMGRGVKWTVNGLSVTKAQTIDFDFSTSTKRIPNELVDAAEGSYKKQLSLDHNGSFGFAAVMTYDIGTKYNGLYANLFYYNSKSKELELVSCSPISDGKANFVLNHASYYLITVTDEPLGEFEDVSAAAGISSGSAGTNAAVFAAVLAVITAAFGAVVYKKRRHN